MLVVHGKSEVLVYFQLQLCVCFIWNYVLILKYENLVLIVNIFEKYFICLFYCCTYYPCKQRKWLEVMFLEPYVLLSKVSCHLPYGWVGISVGLSPDSNRLSKNCCQEFLSFSEPRPRSRRGNRGKERIRYSCITISQICHSVRRNCMPIVCAL